VTWGASLLHDAVRQDASGLVAPELTARGPRWTARWSLTSPRTRRRSLPMMVPCSPLRSGRTPPRPTAGPVAPDARPGRHCVRARCSKHVAAPPRPPPGSAHHPRATGRAPGRRPCHELAERLGITVRTVDDHLPPPTGNSTSTAAVSSARCSTAQHTRRPRRPRPCPRAHPCRDARGRAHGVPGHARDERRREQLYGVAARA